MGDGTTGHSAVLYNVLETDVVMAIRKTYPHVRRPSSCCSDGPAWPSCMTRARQTGKGGYFTPRPINAWARLQSSSSTPVHPDPPLFRVPTVRRAIAAAILVTTLASATQWEDWIQEHPIRSHMHDASPSSDYAPAGRPAWRRAGPGRTETSSFCVHVTANK